MNEVRKRVGKEGKKSSTRLFTENLVSFSYCEICLPFALYPFHSTIALYSNPQSGSTLDLWMESFKII